MNSDFKEISRLEIRAVGENIFLIDNNLYSVPMSGAVYCIAAEKKVLIDAGPATSAATVLQSLSQIGIQAAEIDYLILTHIHIDHGGGAGTLLKKCRALKFWPTIWRSNI